MASSPLSNVQLVIVLTRSEAEGRSNDGVERSATEKVQTVAIQDDPLKRPTSDFFLTGGGCMTQNDKNAVRVHCVRPCRFFD